MRNFKNITELYENGYQSILLCRDCWQTNYMHEDDVKVYTMTCMCGYKFEISMQSYSYDFTDSKFLWFKPKRHVGKYSMLESLRLS